MTGKVIESGATGILVLILPFALALVFIFTAWPILLALLVLGIAVKIWQQYQWKQWSQQVDPYFHQLIKDNHGCLTPLDLSLKANLTGGAAKRFLDKKAEEYGAQQKTYQDKGIVYYFLTASALGSIFDESEPLSAPERQVLTQEPSQQPHITSSEIEELLEPSAKQESDQQPQPPLKEQKQPEEEQDTDITLEVEEPSVQPTVEEHLVQPTKEETSVEEPTIDSESEASSTETLALIQAELANRLDVNASTVSKRKSDDDFAEWSQSRDPEGIPWKYSPETKMFVPLDS